MRLSITRSTRRAAFSVLELLLAIAIMVFIIFGLYAVFDQTQKALRQTVAQVDVLEGVRAATDLMSRELEGISYVPISRYTNIFIALNPISQGAPLNGLSDQQPVMTTVLQDIFFHVRVGEQWSAIGYWVGPIRPDITGPIAVGRLYRFATNVSPAQLRAMANPNRSAAQRNALLSTFNSEQRLNYSAPIMDGVVHLRVTAYAPDGNPLVNLTSTNAGSPTYLRLFEDALVTLRSQGILSQDAYPAAQLEAGAGSVRYLFSDLSYPTHPSYLELELGVLEPQVVIQYQSIAEGQPAEAARFLARNSGRIHLFRQRIPLRNTPQP